MKKIAIVETSYIGDLTFLFPSFKALKRKFPESKITLITTPIQAQAAELLPYVDNIITYDKRGKERGLRILKMKNKLVEHFHILLAPHKFGSTKLISKIISADIKISYNTFACSLFFDKCGTYNSKLVVEKRMNELLKYIGIKLQDEDFKLSLKRNKIDSFSQKNQLILKDPFIFIVPGSNWESKRWPTPYYATIARWLCEKGYKVYSAGSKKEDFILNQLNTLSKGCVKILNVTLQEMLLYIFFSQLVIGNDTGPIHVARIMGKPVVTIFGPTPHNIFTWNKYQLPIYLKGLNCRPCSAHGPRHCPKDTLSCLFDLKAEEIWSKIEWLLKKS